MRMLLQSASIFGSSVPGDENLLLFSQLVLSICSSDAIESILCGALFPAEFSVKNVVENWIRIFAGLDKVEVKALEKILEQKQRYAFFVYDPGCLLNR